MRKKTKNKLIILIILVTLIIVELIAFNNSRANKTIEINIGITDADQSLKEEIQTWSALSDEKGNYYILLPEYINNYKVSKYEVAKTNNDTSKEENKSENETINENKIISNSLDNVTANQIKNEQTNIVETTSNNEIDNNIKQTTNLQSYNPGDKIYLSDNDVKNKAISLNVTYDKKEKNGETLYYKKIYTEVNKRKIQIEG